MPWKKKKPESAEPPADQESDPPETESTHDSNAGPATPESESMDQIRDILFGRHLQTLEQHFAQLEERLVRERAEIEEQFNRRHASLQADARKEFDALAARLTAEVDRWAESLRQLSGDVDAKKDALAGQIVESEDRAVNTAREIRDEAHEQSAKFSKGLREQDDMLTLEMTRQANDLRSAKLDRTALAGLLTEMASRLVDSAPSESAG